MIVSLTSTVVYQAFNKEATFYISWADRRDFSEQRKKNYDNLAKWNNTNREGYNDYNWSNNDI